MTVHVSVALEEDQKAAIDAIASARDQSVAEVVHEAVEEYLAYDRWFRAEVVKGLDSLDRGESYTLEEVMDGIKAKLAKAKARHRL